MKNIVIGLFVLASVLAAHAQSWTNRFNGSADLNDYALRMVVDNAGNVIITGGSDTGTGSFQYECVTIKYSASGIPLWTNRFSNPDGSSTLPVGIAADAAGSSFLAVDRGAIVKYSNAGLPLWTNLNYFGQLNLSGIAVDSVGKVCITGFSTATRFLTSQYSNEGVPLWTNRHNTPDGKGGALAIKVDANDNVIIAGESDPEASNFSFGTIKYSASGAGLWTNFTYHVPGVSSLNGMAVDGQGNVFLTGINGVYGVPESFDGLTLKYSSTGTLLWSRRFNGPGNDVDWLTGLALDRDGNVIVAGATVINSSEYGLTLKYSSAGNPLWTNYFGSLFSEFNVAVDRIGNVFVAGGLTTRAYSSSGEELWTSFFPDIPGSSASNWKAIAVDYLGNVIVTGNLSHGDSGLSWDYLTIKYGVGISPPFLNIQRLGNNAVLSWSEAAFGLQAAPAVTGTFTNVPGATSPYTNTISGGQGFFRLAQ